MNDVVSLAMSVNSGPLTPDISRSATHKGTRKSYLFVQFQHHIWNLDILLRLILRGDLKDDILLVLRNGFLANRLYQLAQPILMSTSTRLRFD